MSLKPIKKGDLGKSWLNKRTSKIIKIQPEHHLIATEGVRTEPAYFKAIQTIINSKYREKIQLKTIGIGNNTLNLLNKVKKYVKNNKNIYKHVWIVYDVDDFPEESVNKVVSSCKALSNSETKYHAIWSNRCIEIWFLLHFDYIDSEISPIEYYTKLSRYLAGIGRGEYKKNRRDMYDILEPYMEVAIQNAKCLANTNLNKTAYDSRPGTEVHKLVEKLLPYLHSV